MRTVPLALLLALSAVALPSCGKPAREVRSAVLITLDTTNAIALGCYSGREGLTPHLEELAREGIVYLRARSVAPLTLPSHSSMLTGLYPPRHTVRDNGLTPLPDAAETLAEQAREAGIETAAFVAAIVLSSSYGLDQGFDLYDEPNPGQARQDLYMLDRPAKDVAARAIAWLAARDRSRPFFLWVHFFDPHFPYVPEKQYLDQVSEMKVFRPEYAGEVMQMDAAIGDLLAAIDQHSGLDRTFVAVAGDHGEALGRHREATHSIFVYDATIRVPLLLRYPDAHRAGERTREIVSVADLHPTLLEAMGLEAAADVDGISLYRKEVPAERGVYYESYAGFLGHGWSPLSGWADERASYIHSSLPELFITGDSEQASNALAEHPELAREHRSQIDRVASRPALPRAEALIDDEERERIRELGYVGGGDPGAPVPHPLDVSQLPAPRRRVAQMKALMRAGTLMDRGEVDEAIAQLRGILETAPEDLATVEALAGVLGKEGRFGEVVELLEAARERIGWRKNCLVMLAQALIETGRRAEALPVLLRSHQQWPTDQLILLALVNCLEGLGKKQEAESFRLKLN